MKKLKTRRIYISLSILMTSPLILKTNLNTRKSKNLVLSVRSRIVCCRTGGSAAINSFFRQFIAKDLFIYIIAVKDDSIMRLMAKYCFEVLTAFDSLSN